MRHLQYGVGDSDQHDWELFNQENRDYLDALAAADEAREADQEFFDLMIERMGQREYEVAAAEKEDF